MINILEFTNKMIKHKIDANQLYFCLCLMNREEISLSRAWKHILSDKLKKEQINDLIDKNCIKFIKEGLPLNSNNLMTTDSFREGFVSHEEEAKKLFNCYFEVIEVNGIRYSGKNISFNSFLTLYEEALSEGENPDEMLELTKKYVKEGNNHIGLEKYMIGRGWKIMKTEEKNEIIQHNTIE